MILLCEKNGWNRVYRFSVFDGESDGNTARIEDAMSVMIPVDGETKRLEDI